MVEFKKGDKVSVGLAKINRMITGEIDLIENNKVVVKNDSIRLITTIDKLRLLDDTR